MKFANIINRNSSDIVFCYLKRYLKHLLEKRYTTWTIYHYVEHIQQFNKYIQKRNIKSLREISPVLVERYLKYRCKMFGYKNKTCYMTIIKSVINQFMVYLSEQGIIKSNYWNSNKEEFMKNIPHRLQNIIREYSNFCLSQCGLRKRTLSIYRSGILKLASFIKEKEIKDIRLLKITDIDEFISKYIIGLGRSSIISIHSALRSFFRFLYMYDYIDRDFSKEIFSSKTYQQRLIPKHTSAEIISDILAQVDTKTVIGKRDYAILILLARYGLRPSEVVKLSDIDFIQNKIYLINRKCSKDLVLPLLKDVSNTVSEYLKVRPDVTFEEIFVTSNAPYRPLSPVSISTIVGRYINKGKLNVPMKSAYLFRHSLAKMLLEKGASITDIASILGHSCIGSTMNYLRISIRELKKCSDNYANLL